MNKYVEHLLSLYKEKQLSHSTTLSLLEAYKKEHEISETTNPIAIVGLACNMPMAPSKEAFWKCLQSGTNCVGSFPKERRKDTDPLIPLFAHNLRSTTNPYWEGGFLENVDTFDNDFFHILPSEAAIMDPQQRMFLETAASAFEDAGYSSKALRGSKTGVFIGDVVNEYQKIVSSISPLAVIGNYSPFIASRVSHFYDLHGPTINVSTTCSTSLVAAHLAYQSLLSFECNLAIVGAVNLRLFPFCFLDDPIDALGLTSEKNTCYVFDERACGIVRGEGIGAIVLKRYQDALRDKNYIYALVRGSAVNNDGRSSSVGAPNPLAQADLLTTAWKKGQINPRDISYIEAHGTGTRIGDPIEIQGISKAISESTQDKQFCGIGSVKTNIGHLTGGGSGLAGLIKTVLALEKEQIPPSLHFDYPNEFIDFPNTPLYVIDRLTAWPKTTKPRLAGVSAFGFNGTNCHMILEEAPLSQKTFQSLSQPLPFLFTHRTASGLKKQISLFYSFFKQHKEHLRLEDISYTLFYGRDHHPVQTLIMARSIDELIEKLNSSTSPHTSPIEWEKVFHSLDPQFISLPTYCFEGKRFWLDVPEWKEVNVSSKPCQRTTEISSSLEQLVLVFQDVMGLKSIQAEDNFFELGGDSLFGVEIIAQIHKKLNKKISYNNLFQHPKILDLHAFLNTKETSSFQNIPQAPQQKVYPLSFGQRRLWILHHMQDNPIAYNIYDTYQFDSSIDVEALQHALSVLVERHSSLRTTFVTIDGEPYQKVSPLSTFDLTSIDASSHEEAHENILQFRSTPFCLEKGPLAKALLQRLNDTCFILFFMVHHIISDGWSIRIIIDELLKLYKKNSLLLPLRIDTIDYCHWQQTKHSETRFKESEQFWLKHLSSPLPLCEIPGDKQRPAVFHFQGARKVFHLSKELTETLSLCGKKQNATLFMVLLSSIYTLIYRYTGQIDLIVGSPVSGRSHADLKSLVGFFVNTLAFRCLLNPDEPFSSLLKRVATMTLEALEHQDYPFDHLIDLLKLERDTSRSPLFNINVAFQNFELEEKNTFAELKAKRIDIPQHSCKWDLEFEFVKDPQGSLTCFVEYYTGVYSEEMISLLISTYQSLLHSFKKNGFETPICLIELSPVSYGISGLSVPYPSLTLHKLFEQNVELYKDLPAIKTEDSFLSYKEVNEKANKLAHLLHKEKNLRQEECVGLYLENSNEAIIAILAILKAGGTYVPLDYKAPLERIRQNIEEAKITILLSKKKYLRAINDLLWSSSLESYICLDSEDISQEIEGTDSYFMNEALWDQVAIEGVDEISSSGWVSSYTGKPFSQEEMKEYTENVLHKLLPFLHSSCRVLEIGCGSGLTAFTLAPHVGFYYGVDLSEAILQKNREKALLENHHHLHFAHYLAHEINLIPEKNFDIIIINSVIHCFPGQNYLKNVIQKALSLTKESAILFLGDLLDAALKPQLEDSLRSFKEEHRHESLRTKTEMGQELFISKDFLLDLQGDFSEIKDVLLSKKIGLLENELTQFRFDSLFILKKSAPQKISFSKKKQNFDLSHLEKQLSSNLDLPISDKNLAYVLFTSGSTGRPKGVMVEHRSVHNYIMWAKSYYGTDSAHFPLYSSLHFDLTVTSIFTPLLSGGYIRIFKGEIDEILDSLQRASDCSIIKMTPTHLSMMIEREEVPHTISRFIIGGETLYASQALALSAFYTKPIFIHNEYGPTEATVGCITHTWNSSENEGPLLIGDPIFNCKIHIMDENLLPVPIGGIGEILIEGDCLARGYINQKELTEQKFIHHPTFHTTMYRTGDIGRLLPHNKIASLGRKDRQIKLKGYRIELDDIEAQLLKHKNISSCIVIPRTDTSRGTYLCGYYTAHIPKQHEELVQFLSNVLPAYMIPSSLMQLETMPITRNGKIDTAKLPHPELQKTKQRVLPKTDIESSLVTMWSTLLKVPENEISTEDDFFDLGGDSIIAMRLLHQMKQINICITIKEIFQYRTIATLSQKVSHKKPCIESIKSKIIKAPLTPIQRWFINQKVPHPAYFTMAYLFLLERPLDVSLLEKAFFLCFEHHDAFRLIFKDETQELTLQNLDFHIEEYTLDSEQELFSITTLIQNSFDLEKAPLIKAAIIHIKGKKSRFFITTHHLIIDGVSWRYLIEDLTTLYSSSLQKSLPQKTCSSYLEWAHALSLSPPVKQSDIEHWLSIDHTLCNFIIYPNNLKNRFFPLTEEVSLVFSTKETEILFKKGTSFHNANVNEILLSSLVSSCSEIFGRNKIAIHHEGHGRQGLLDIDISRTIGWFTTLYPIVLEDLKSPIDTLLKTKENLAFFSQNDIFYGIAKWMQKHPQLLQLNPEILFNYFGRVGDELTSQGADGLFYNCEQTIGPTSHQENPLAHVLEINAIIIEEQLHFSFVYNPKKLDKHTFNCWKNSFKACIMQYIFLKQKEYN